MNFHGKDIKIFTGSSNVDVAQGIAAVSVCRLVRVTVHSSQTAKSLFLFTNLFVVATALLFSQPALPSTTILWKCS